MRPHSTVVFLALCVGACAASQSSTIPSSSGPTSSAAGGEATSQAAAPTEDPTSSEPQQAAAPPVAPALDAPPVAQAAAPVAVDAGTPLVSAPRPRPPADKPPSATSKPAEQGKYPPLKPVPPPDKKTERVWKSKCASCHGADGKAATEKGQKMKVADMTVASWQSAHTDAALAKAISEGLKRERGGVRQEMDGYGSELSAEQVGALVQFVRFIGSPHSALR